MSKPNQTKIDTEELTERQKKVIPFLIASTTNEEGRKKAGISKATLYEWLKISQFKKELDKQRNEMVDEAMSELKLNINKAINTLVGLLDQRGTPELKRRVCNDIISYIFRFKEVEEFDARLQTVERLILERKTYK